MTFDALYIYKDMANRHFRRLAIAGDAWRYGRCIDPIAPGTGSLLLLTVTLYWLAFARGGADDCAALALACSLCCRFWRLSPPAFVFVGIIWRDILFAVVWMLAAAAGFRRGRSRLENARSGTDHRARSCSRSASCCARMRSPPRRFSQPTSSGPSDFPGSARRSSMCPPRSDCLGWCTLSITTSSARQRQHPLHSIMVFDLGGISHFAKKNVFPGAWTAKEAALITDGCYQPIAWDIYWTQEPCLFVMERLEGEKLFGTPALTTAWRHAIIGHPIAYLRAPRHFLLDVPRRREPDHVDAGPRRSRQDHFCR